jgi:rhodanese-related sulfurtransferase
MLNQDLAKLDKERPVYVICETGRRSAKGAKILNEAGFGQVYSIAGGTSVWKSVGLPIE